MKELISAQNPWWASGRVPASRLGAYRRELFQQIVQELGSVEMTGVIGPRRAGKTVLLHQTIAKLLEDGTEPDRIVYVQFETRKLCKEGILIEILEFAAERLREPYTNFTKKVYLFFDEVHHLSSWAEELKQIYDMGLNVKLFVSSSSSLKVLKGSGESLLGRIRHNVLLPLSFREYASDIGGISVPAQDIRNIKYGKLAESESALAPHIARLKLLFKGYLLSGGYPQALQETDAEKRLRILNDFKDLALQRDLFETEQIRDIKTLQEALELAASSVGSRVNYNKFATYLNVKLDTAKKYIGLLEDVFLIKEARVFSGKKQHGIRRERKVYFVDTGMLNAIEMRFGIKDDEMPRLVENAVAAFVLEKLYRYSISPVMHYWTDKYEVDFVFKVGDFVLPIEVKYQENPQGIDGLLEFMEKFDAGTGVVLTKNTLKRERIGKYNVLFIPAWLFLLVF